MRRICHTSHSGQHFLLLDLDPSVGQILLDVLYLLLQFVPFKLQPRLPLVLDLLVQALEQLRLLLKRVDQVDVGVAQESVIGAVDRLLKW